MDSKERFSERVDTYVKYRPSYPIEAVDCLYNTVGISQKSIIADIGAGTGIMSELLLARGSKVIAVEPNVDMRQMAEKRLSNNLNFRIQPCPAEETGLDDQSVDAVICAQSFHWFDRQAAGLEFRRILKPKGKVVLIWNSRLTEGSEFLTDYEQLLQGYGTDYKEVKHTNITPDQFDSFFKEGTLQLKEFTNRQIFDYEGLKGRLLSSSYSPVPGHPKHEPMLDELQSLFDRTQKNNEVYFDYKTQVFWGEV